MLEVVEILGELALRVIVLYEDAGVEEYLEGGVDVAAVLVVNKAFDLEGLEDIALEDGGLDLWQPLLFLNNPH